jgi:hypothetical protein
VPLSQFIKQQADPSALMSLVGGFAHRTFGGKANALNEEVLAGMLPGMGILSTQGLPPNILLPLAGALIKGDLGSFKKLSAEAAAAEKKVPESAKSFEQQMADLASGETPWITRMLQYLDTMAQDLTTLALGIPQIVSGIGNAIKGLWTGFISALGTIFKNVPGLGGIGDALLGLISGNHGSAGSSGGSPSAGGSVSAAGGGLALPAGHGGDTSFASNAEINTLMAAGKKYGVNPYLMLAIAGRESNFGKTSSNVGQITSPVIQQALATPGSPIYSMRGARGGVGAITGAVNSDPQMNAALQAWYLSYLAKTHQGASDAQIAAMYNGGPGNPQMGYGNAVAKTEHQIEVILKNEQGKELARAKTTAHTQTGYDAHRTAKGSRAHHPQQPPPRPTHSTNVK